MHTRRFKIAIRAAREERGVTLIEALVVMTMTGLVAAAASYLLIVAVKTQPRISDRNYAIQQGRILEDRFIHELRSSSKVIPTPNSQQITFDTYLRRVQCGGAVQTIASQPAILCRITYGCTAGICNRTEAPIPGHVGTTTSQELVRGLSSSAVFGYSPSALDANYVSVHLVFPAEGADDAVTLDDGVNLRNR